MLNVCSQCAQFRKVILKRNKGKKKKERKEDHIVTKDSQNFFFFIFFNSQNKLDDIQSKPLREPTLNTYPDKNSDDDH